MELERQPSFLDEDEQAEQREKEADAAMVLAQNHLVFETDPRAAALLKMWEEQVVTTVIPVGAPIDAYARAEAVRAFVGMIRRQVNIAKTGKLA